MKEIFITANHLTSEDTLQSTAVTFTDIVKLMGSSTFNCSLATRRNAKNKNLLSSILNWGL